MKVLCALAAAIAAVCFALPTSYSAAYNSAAADGVYLYGRAEDTSAYFCSEADLTTALFTIPYTYCVRIISEDGMWYYVSYAEDSGEYRTLYGYVLQSHITVLDETPPTIWLRYTITVTYSQGSSGNLPTLSDITATAAFYGNYYSGASGYSYVLCQGSFGYIMGATENYELVEIDYGGDDDGDTGSTSADGKVIAGVVLGVIAVAALAVVFMSGRAKSHRRES